MDYLLIVIPKETSLGTELTLCKNLQSTFICCQPMRVQPGLVQTADNVIGLVLQCIANARRVIADLTVR